MLLLSVCLTVESALIRSRDQPYPTVERHQSHYNPLHTFDLAKGDQKHYQQQYGDMYFLRLAKLKPAVEELAIEAWDGLEVGPTFYLRRPLAGPTDSRRCQIAGDVVRRVDRVLDVRQGELCWVAGTVYMDMPLKPNILDDISKDVRSPPTYV